MCAGSTPGPVAWTFLEANHFHGVVVREEMQLKRTSVSDTSSCGKTYLVLPSEGFFIVLTH